MLLYYHFLLPLKVELFLFLRQIRIKQLIHLFLCHKKVLNFLFYLINYLLLIMYLKMLYIFKLLYFVQKLEHILFFKSKRRKYSRSFKIVSMRNSLLSPLFKELSILLSYRYQREIERVPLNSFRNLIHLYE